jgi:hypothetical protein
MQKVHMEIVSPSVTTIGLKSFICRLPAWLTADRKSAELHEETFSHAPLSLST